MREHLGKRHGFERQGPSAIRSRLPSSKSLWNRRSSDKQRRQHGRDPQDAAGDASQQLEIGADAQRHQCRHRGEKSTASVAPPPARVARRMSRRTSTEECAHSPSRAHIGTPPSAS